MKNAVATDKPRVVAYVPAVIHEELKDIAQKQDQSISRCASKILTEALDTNNVLVKFSPNTKARLEEVAARKGFRTSEDLIQAICIEALEDNHQAT